VFELPPAPDGPPVELLPPAPDEPVDELHAAEIIPSAVAIARMPDWTFIECLPSN
jgi:hypothetical protein